MMKKNKAKEKLINGEPILGIFQGFNSIDLTEMCGYSGYDFIILDTEHGPMSAETCIPMICAAERTLCFKGIGCGGNGNRFSHD